MLKRCSFISVGQMKLCSTVFLTGVKPACSSVRSFLDDDVILDNLHDFL